MLSVYRLLLLDEVRVSGCRIDAADVCRTCTWLLQQCSHVSSEVAASTVGIIEGQYFALVVALGADETNSAEVTVLGTVHIARLVTFASPVHPHGTHF